ncbi:MAG: hypothetical protein DRI87_09925, partial [Bacteroidetes bacterium]
YLFDRGFTGHEHLDNFDLINMNGRVYDPWLGRFLSPDNFVQSATYSQNFNRYSYALNNPLKYTDPDGEWINLVIGAVIGGVSGYIAGDMAGATGWDLVAYIGVGAVAGALSSGIGSGVSAALAGNAAAGGGFIAGFTGTASIYSTGFVAGAVSGAAAGVTNGLITGTGYSILEGNGFGEAFVTGGLDQAWKQGLGGAAFGGIMGTLDAINNNEDWLTGSPYKRYSIADREGNIISRDAADAGAMKNKDSFKLPSKEEPYKIEIKAPSGWKMTNGYSIGNLSGEELHPVIAIEKNTQIVEFPIGTPNGGYYGAQVSQPMRVINHYNHLQLFFQNERKFSTLFWYLKFIIK